MKKVGKISLIVLQWVGLSFFSLILLLNLVLCFKRFALKQTNPTIFGVTTAVVQSESMNPTFYKGDLVVIKHFENYSVGDIICYTDINLGSVTHRVVELSPEGYKTKGDNPEADGIENIRKDRVIGKVVKIYSGIGYTIEYIKSPVGLILVFTFFSSLIVLIVCFQKKEKNIGNEIKK